MIDPQKCIDAIDSLKAIQPYLNDAKTEKRVHKLIKYLFTQKLINHLKSRNCGAHL